MANRVKSAVKSTAPAGRFEPAVTAVPRRGSSELAPGTYNRKDQYGFHLLRVLDDGQTILFTVTEGGMLVEKINFVPSKDKRDGNAAYGDRWLGDGGIVDYRQSALHIEDMETLAANGLKMHPEPRKGSKSAASGWTAC